MIPGVSKRWLWIGLAATIIAIGLASARRHDLVRFAVQTGASLASGYTVTLGDQHIGTGRAALFDVHVARAGVPLLDARRIDIAYSLRDLLPGSTRRFGLVAIDVSGAKLSVVRFTDGTYNFIVPTGKAGLPHAALAQPVSTVPLRFALHMHDAALELREPKAYDVSANRIRIEHFDVDAAIDTATRTHYTAAGAFVAARGPMPFTILGTIDAVRGYAMHHGRAPRFPLRALANYFADTPIVRILKGRARNFDARLYAFDVQPNVAPNYHVNLQVDIDGGALALSALAAPVEDIHGRLQLVDNAFFLRHIHAKLTGIPLHLTGGIYDLTGDLTGAAQLRLGIYGSGDLTALRRAFAFTRNEPISGNVTLGVLVEGPIDNPLIIAHARAPRAVYRALPFDWLDAGVLYRDNVVALLPLHAFYDGTDVGIKGTLAIGARLHSLLAVHLAGTADRMPYLDEMLGREPMLVDAVASGEDTDFRVRGAAASAAGVARVAALVALDPDGTAAIAPFWLHTQRGDFDGAYALDRPHGTSGFWAIGSNVRMQTVAHQAFPGVPLPAIPSVSGHIDRVAVAGGGSGSDIVLAGTVIGNADAIAGMHFDRIDAAFSGTLANARIGRLRASGPWGNFNGSGAFSSQAFAAAGDYRGTFEGLQPFLGSAIPAHGRLAGRTAFAVLPSSVIVQAPHLAMQDATLRGVPVSDVSITLGIEGDLLRIYSAHARAAGGDVVAAGTFALNPSRRGAPSGALSLIADDLNAAQLRGLGLPLERGNLWATGDLAAGAPLPSFGGGVTIAHGSIAHYALAGNGDVQLSGETARLDRVVGALGTTYAHVSGSLNALASGGPVYALSAYVPAGDIAAALHSLHFPNYETVGSFNARLQIGGAAASPVVSGHVGVPAGAINGLHFIDGNASLAAGAQGVSARDGRVRFATTPVAFNAATHPGGSTIDVAAPRADLSDFNDFFDTGDTLDGSGAVKITAAVSGDRLATSGNVAVRGFRYRNLPIGDTNVTWSSTRNAVDGSLAVGGDHGRLRAGGSIGFLPQSTLDATLERSHYDLSGSVNNLDLSLWVAALGFPNVPVTGRASGNATVHGRYPHLALTADAAITGGTIGPLTLDTAAAGVHSSGSRLIVKSAQLVTPGLSASASGSLGLGPHDPLDVAVHASTDDLPRLVYQLARVKIPVSGAFESTLQIRGTIAEPTFAAGLDANNVRAYGIGFESLFGEVRLHGRSLVLSNAGATFAKGEATLAGSLPLELAPFGIGPPGQPVNFDLDVTGLDPSVFDGVLGNNAKLGGTIDGHIGLTGTVHSPIVVGHAELTKGSYVSDLERTPITDATARLVFSRTDATIDRVSARLGSGSVQGSATIGLRSGTGGGYTIAAKGTARDAQLNLPTYGSGAFDADLALNKTPSSTALLSGHVTINDATLPFAAFVQAAEQAPQGAGAPLPLTFDLQATAGKNVRVRGSGYGAGLDIGVAGKVHLQGTLSSPQLDGTIASTGGTLTYFDRAFRVREGNVAFTPTSGVIPTIHAVATTNVVNPDPDRARNPYGNADITINVDGPIDGLKIGFDSNPPGYSREQVLSMIAPFGGFINGIAFNTQSPYQVQSPGGITPYGALSPLPPGAYQTRSGTITAGQEAFNLLNAQFAAGLLSPLENALGEGLGLSSVNLTLGYYGNVGLTATRLLGKNVSAIYATTFGQPQVQSFGVKFNPSAYTAATLNFYYVTGPIKLFDQPVTVLGSSNQLLALPLLGTNGFSFNLQRYL